MPSPAAVVFQDVLELQSQKSVIEEVKLTAKTLKVEFTFLVFEKKKWFNRRLRKQRKKKKAWFHTRDMSNIQRCK